MFNKAMLLPLHSEPLHSENDTAQVVFTQKAFAIQSHDDAVESMTPACLICDGEEYEVTKLTFINPEKGNYNVCFAMRCITPEGLIRGPFKKGTKIIMSFKIEGIAHKLTFLAKGKYLSETVEPSLGLVYVTWTVYPIILSDFKLMMNVD